MTADRYLDLLEVRGVILQYNGLHSFVDLTDGVAGVLGSAIIET